MRILIVDDNVDLAENVAEILGDAGFETDVFSDPGRALTELMPGRYAAALLDIRMPGMDGVELYRRVKERDPGLPALAMTAYAQDDRIRAAVEQGMVAVFPKPLDVPQLLSQLSTVSKGEAVLVIEDDVDLAQNLVDLLLMRGISARAAHTAAEARRIAAARSFRRLLVDVRLPDGDGIELIQEIRRKDGSCEVVLFSGSDRATVDPEGRAAAAPFFQKPLDLEALLRVMASRGD